ncbi:MAG: pimeloyl-ACP methyl ester carboxylesterase [Alphaproteobacteria bacterium]|jgi:pimeloyl-ACP methyl ester carboxylesterase
MSIRIASDGTALHYEVTGSGPDVLFIHEFAGTLKSWEPQIRRLSRQYRCIAFNARGYPPSDVPDDPSKYSQDIAIDDAFAVLDAAGSEAAHVVGHSMGGYTALHLGIRDPARVRSLTVAGCGWGSAPNSRDESRALIKDIVAMFEKDGIEEAARRYADFPMRHRFRDKDPRGWAEFAALLATHSAKGSAHTMAQVQMERPTLFEMQGDLAKLTLPLLIVVGDEDEACLDGCLMMKQKVPNAGLYVVPFASHTINSEDPALFNQALLDFLSQVECGAFPNGFD